MTLLLALLFLQLNFTFGQKPNVVYDSVLTKDLGADEHDIKPYFVMLTFADNRVKIKIIIEQYFQGQLDKILKTSH